MQFEPKQKQIDNVNQKGIKLPCICSGSCKHTCKQTCGSTCHIGGACRNLSG